MILPLLTLELHYIIDNSLLSMIIFATWRTSLQVLSLMHVLLLVGMLLVNVCVYDTCCSKSPLCWTILRSDDDRLTLAKFYETATRARDEHIVPEISLGIMGASKYERIIGTLAY